jgi:predicted aspartyl protease
MRRVGLLVALLAGFASGWYMRGFLVATPEPMPSPPPAPVVAAPEEDALFVAFVENLEAQRHDAALASYEDIADPGLEPVLTERLRGRMFAPIRERGGAGLEEGVAFLEAFTWLYARDVEALTVLAQGQERLGRLREALDSWWRVAEAAGGGTEAERARRRARLLVDVLADGARTRDDRGSLAATYREALDRDPGAHRFRMLLADVLDEDGAHDAALEVLEGIPLGVLDEERLERVRARLVESSRLATAFPDGLPLRPLGEHFVVEVGTGSDEVLELLLDTGATVTVLRPGALGRVPGAEPAGRTIRLGTAGGVVSAPLYRVDALSLGPVKLRDLRVAVMPLEGLEEVDGLLGMDQLSRFDFRIDPSAGRLLLAHRRD